MKIAMVFAGIVTVLGCVTLGTSLLLSAVLPNVLQVYLTANPCTWSSGILQTDMTGVNILAAAEIALGLIGMVGLGMKAKD